MARMQRSGQDEQQQRVEIIEILEPPNLDDRLARLQTELEEHNDRIDHLSKQRDVLQDDITDLTTTVKQVTTTVTNYGAGLKDLHHRFQTLDYFYHQKSKMILAAIGDKKALIGDLIRLYDEELEGMRAHLQRLDEKQKTAEQESNGAESVQKALQEEYDKINSYQQYITDNLTEMDGLRTDITKADELTDVATMYFLILEFHNKLRETTIHTQHQLSLELRQKLGELETAKENARARSAALSSAQAEYTAHKKKLDTKITERRSTLLKAVDEIYPVPSEAGATSDVAAGTTPTVTSAASSSDPGTPATAADGADTTTPPASPKS
jgi:DNA repair exonuclease SbcCD ATPase subunit